MKRLVVGGKSCYNRKQWHRVCNYKRGICMEWKAKAVGFLKKYKHAWVFSYILIYMPWFCYLEKHVTNNYYVIHSVFDDRIPFVEYFIVPYLLWFVFIAVVFLYFFFTDVEGFYKLAKLSFAGMTIFLIISTLVPNGLDLRPVVFERDNIFTDLVKMVYQADTPTNVFPSLHVFNSLAACIAINQSKRLNEKHKGWCIAAYVLASLIIMATVFLKQHSVLDVVAGFVLAYALFQWVYVPEGKHALQAARQRRIQEKKGFF